MDRGFRDHYLLTTTCINLLPSLHLILSRYIPLATLPSNTSSSIFPSRDNILFVYTTCPSMLVSSSHASSSCLAAVPSVPVIVNAPLFGLGIMLISPLLAVVTVPPLLRGLVPPRVFTETTFVAMQ